MTTERKSQIEDLFSEYEQKRAHEEDKRKDEGEALRKGLADFQEALTKTILPALSALALDLKAKDCRVETKSAGPGVGVDEATAHPRVTIRIWPPTKQDVGLVPFEATYAWTPSDGAKLNVKRWVRSSSLQGSEPLDATSLTRELVTSTILTQFRDVLLEATR